MERVVLDGKEYTKAKLVAKEFGYTSDYLGQLCRGKKIDCRLVGRTWFVDTESLDTHRVRKKPGARRTKSSPDSRAPEHPGRTVSVSPVQRKSTTRMLRVSGGDLEATGASAYSDDVAPLMPTIQEPKQVRVRGGHTQSATSFAATPLPEVALHGTLKVTSLSDDISVDNIEKQDYLVKTSNTPTRANEELEVAPESETREVHTSESDLGGDDEVVAELDMLADELPIEVVQEEVLEETISTTQRSYLLPITAGVAVLLGVAIVAAEHNITVFASDSSSNLSFQLANLITIFLP